MLFIYCQALEGRVGDEPSSCCGVTNYLPFTFLYLPLFGAETQLVPAYPGFKFRQTLDTLKTQEHIVEPEKRRHLQP